MHESDLQPEQPTHERPVVLLTEATGYTGSRLLPLLEQRGVRVRCLASDERQASANLPR